MDTYTHILDDKEAYEALSKLHATEAGNQILELVSEENKKRVRELLELIVTEMTGNATHRLWN